MCVYWCVHQWPYYEGTFSKMFFSHGIKLQCVRLWTVYWEDVTSALQIYSHLHPCPRIASLYCFIMFAFSCLSRVCYPWIYSTWHFIKSWGQQVSVMFLFSSLPTVIAACEELKPFFLNPLTVTLSCCSFNQSAASKYCTPEDKRGIKEAVTPNR